jgi:hypothetical protein
MKDLQMKECVFVVEKKTVKHLFVECNNESIMEMRTRLLRQINTAIAKHVEDVWINTNFIKSIP